MGQPSLGPTFCELSVSAMAMACDATLAASTTACAITAFEPVYSVAIFVYLLVCFMLLIFLSLL